MKSFKITFYIAIAIAISVAFIIRFFMGAPKPLMPVLAPSTSKPTELGAKSITYYITHFDETTLVVKACTAILNSEVSLMTSTQKKEFYDTQRGINCRNAESGYHQGWIPNRIKQQEKAMNIR